MDTLTLIGTLLNPITGAIAWVFGTRSRKNTAIQEMLRTINDLSHQNAELNKHVIELQEEIIEVRRENAELKAGQEAMTRQIAELKAGKESEK